MDKQKQVFKVLTFTTGAWCVCAILAWLGLTRLLQMDRLPAVYLATVITLFLQVTVSVGITQNIRHILMGQSTTERLTDTKEFSQRTNKRLTYIAGGILLLLILTYFVLPRPIGSKTFVVIVIGLAVLRVLSRPLLQLY